MDLKFHNIFTRIGPGRCEPQDQSFVYSITVQYTIQRPNYWLSIRNGRPLRQRRKRRIGIRAGNPHHGNARTSGRARKRVDRVAGCGVRR
jgi:hypothetical protein